MYHTCPVAAGYAMPAFALKGVSDHGTPKKDDAFHRYAAEMAALWVYALVSWQAIALISAIRHQQVDDAALEF